MLIQDSYNECKMFQSKFQSVLSQIDFFSLIKQYFNATIQIVNQIVWLESKNPGLF